MKPPQQPNPREAREILQCQLVIPARREFEDVPFRARLDRLVQRLKFDLLLTAEKADRANCQRRFHNAFAVLAFIFIPVPEIHFGWGKT